MAALHRFGPDDEWSGLLRAIVESSLKALLLKVAGSPASTVVHEGPRRAVARVVQHLGRQILTRAALAAQQHS